MTGGFSFCARLAKDLLRTALGLLDNSILPDQSIRFFTCYIKGAVGFLLRLRHDTIAL